MVTDATTQLIEKITSQLPPSDQTTPANMASLLGKVDAVVGIAANYAQLFTLFGGIESGAAVAAAATEKALAGGTGAQVAQAATAGAEGSAAVGSWIVLFISIIIAAISELVGSSSGADSQAAILTELINIGVGTENNAVADYWATVQGLVVPDWDNVYRDLENIAAQYNKAMPEDSGPEVKGYAGQFILDAQTLVINLTTEPGMQGAGVANPDLYWQRPYAPNLVFTVQEIPYNVAGTYFGGAFGRAWAWYGSWPRPQQSETDTGDYVQDPNTMLPVLLWALQAYLTIEQLANQLDPTQYTFAQFIQIYSAPLPGEAVPGGYIGGYAAFVATQFALAIGVQNWPVQDPPVPPVGFQKSDVPGIDDIAFWVADNYLLQTEPGQAISQPFPTSPAAGRSEGWLPSAGYGWNGVYGVVDAFAVYPSRIQLGPGGVFTPACIVAGTDSQNLAAEIDQATAPLGGNIGLLPAALLVEWLGPWLQNRVILRLMARWKALYLFRGYDKVWSLIQSLYGLAGQLATLPTLTLPDGTLANGNWSVRELCGVLILEGSAGDVIITGGLTSDDGSGYSVRRLLQVFDTIAKGSFGGPAIGNPLTMPASFRDRLAAAAV